MSITIVFPALCFTLLCSGGACFHPRPPAAQRRFYNFTTQSHKKAITALPQAAPAIALKFQTPAPRAGGDARKKHLVLIALFFAITPALTPCQRRSLRGPCTGSRHPGAKNFAPGAALLPLRRSFSRACGRRFFLASPPPAKREATCAGEAECARRRPRTSGLTPAHGILIGPAPPYRGAGPMAERPRRRGSPPL